MKNPIYEAFYLKDTGRRHALPVVMTVNESAKEASNIQHDIAMEYHGEVKLSMRGVVVDKEALPLFRKRAIEQFNEAVYGAFRPLLLKIDRALYENDIRTAREGMAQLYNVMMLGIEEET